MAWVIDGGWALVFKVIVFYGFAHLEYWVFLLFPGEAFPGFHISFNWNNIVYFGRPWSWRHLGNVYHVVHSFHMHPQAVAAC